MCGVGLVAVGLVRGQGSEEVARRLADNRNSSRTALGDSEDSPLQSKRSSTLIILTVITLH